MNLLHISTGISCGTIPNESRNRWAISVQQSIVDSSCRLHDFVQESVRTPHIHGARFWEDNHPSTEYILKEMILDNGIHANLQCGYYATAHNEHHVDYEKGDFTAEFWQDCRLEVYGTKGYAWAECNGKFGTYNTSTDGQVAEEKYESLFEAVFTTQIPYAKELAEWMEDDKKVHSCNVGKAYKGFQVFEAIYKSALDFKRIDMPYEENENLIGKMKVEGKECGRWN